MPEGHSVHRIARQFSQNFLGTPVAVSSPQGRFSDGARLLDGRQMVRAQAVGKQMFLEFDNGLWLRVHLGLYGAGDFSGDISVDDTLASAEGRMGQANQRGTVAGAADPAVGAYEQPPGAVGAPRLARLRMSEAEKLAPGLDTWPPEPVGAVRVRLLTARACADLRGPTACEVQTPEEVQASIAKLGPDPLVD